jgi:spermidine synthase
MACEKANFDLQKIPPAINPEERGMDPTQNRSRWFPLFLISCLALFFELSIIRWLSAEVSIFSYFKNLPLLAAFLGLAVGFGLAKSHKNYFRSFPILIGLYVALVLFAANLASSHALAYPSSPTEFLWNTFSYSYWTALGLFLGLIVAFFMLTMLLFIPIGQATGAEMSSHPPVQAYLVNIAASLLGVWLFAALSFFQTPPLVWMGLSLLGIGYYLFSRRQFTRVAAILFFLTWASLFLEGHNIYWSPYSRLDLKQTYLPRASDGKQVFIGYGLQVQQTYYQIMENLSPQYLAQLNGDIPAMEAAAKAYNLPYQLNPPPDRVLIVGAGTGNDIAAALRNGAGHVDAVEIDPAILDLGRKLHPEQPYANPRVTAIVDDARSYFEKTSTQYDIITFGLLDSHSMLSGLSNVRLDSFVYTVESFQQVRNHLKPNGLVAVTFAVEQNWIDERLGDTLAAVFGADHVLASSSMIGKTYIAGPNLPTDTSRLGLTAWHADPELQDVPMATDDWPFLYLRHRTIPDAYWQALAVIGVICFFLIARSFPQALKPRWHFWFLGAAFLLLECKSITELALLFGTTWIVNALAISGVLLMSLLATLYVIWQQKINTLLVYALLFASLALCFFFPLEWFNGLPTIESGVLSTLMLTLPIFFAGIIFSTSLREAGEAAGPLASNLSGSFAGGMLEYGSLIWGIKSLYIIAAIMYGGAFISSRIQKGK